VKDYYKRIEDHEKYYEPVEENTWPSIRILNVGEKIMVYVRVMPFPRLWMAWNVSSQKIKGYLQVELASMYLTARYLTKAVPHSILPDEHSQPLPNNLFCPGMFTDV
jgi:hypothetical protein